MACTTHLLNGRLAIMMGPFRTRYLLALAILLQQPLFGQGSFNGTFEDGSTNFDLTGWTWDCEAPEPGPAYVSYWGVQKLTAVTGTPPDPCSGVTAMQHSIDDVPGATYTISGWAYVDDPNMSASIGFGYVSGPGAILHQGDYTNSTTWDWLQYSDAQSTLFAGYAPLVFLVTSDGLNGYGYAHYDELVLDISGGTTGVPTPAPEAAQVSVSPDGAQLVIWRSSPQVGPLRLFDAVGRPVAVGSPGTTGPVTSRSVNIASLPAGVYLAVWGDGPSGCTARFVKR